MARSGRIGAAGAAARAARAAIGLVAVAAAAYAAHRLAAGTDGPEMRDPVTLLYVGAEDCAPCRAWRRDHRASFLAGLDRERVIYREVIAARTAAAFDEDAWPEDLRAQRAVAAKGGGVPQWIVIRNERPVLTAGGLSQWQSRVLPLIRREESRS